MTLDELRARAVADHQAMRGLVIAVNRAQLTGPYTDDYREEKFDNDFLLVRVDDVDLGNDDICADHWRNLSLIDTYWSASALPGQLGGEDKVSWVFGPTYHQDGVVGVRPGEWADHPLADFLNGIDVDWFVAFARDNHPAVLGDWFEEQGKPREWAGHFFRVKADPLVHDDEE